MGKFSRDKGGRGERELAKALCKLMPGICFRRGVQYKGTPDSPDIIGIDGLNIESKRVEKLNLDKAYAKAIEDSSEDQVAVVMHRKNRKPWLVTFALNDLERFIKIINGVI